MVTKTDQVLRRIEVAATKRFLPIVGRAKGKLLERMVKKVKPKKVLEIGTLVGYSGILIVRNLSSEAILTTMEIDSEIAEIAKKNFNDESVSQQVKMIFGDALKTIPKLKQKFDFVFIDAEKNRYLAYLKLLEKNKLLNPKATILADNVKIFAVDMKDYLDYVRSSKRYRSKYHDFKWDGMESSVSIT